MYVRKTERAAIAARSDRYATALRLASQAWSRIKYEEDAGGRRRRIWGNGYEDYVTDDDVRAWLKGLRVVEDLDDGLEFVRPGYIQAMIQKGWLRRSSSSPYYVITEACAQRFALAPVMGKAFPR